jgi:hypothetical protein
MEEIAEAKTAKNRAKRQKKKERAKAKPGKAEGENTKNYGDASAADLPIKKRRLVNGKELVFKKPGEASDDEESDEERGPGLNDDDVSLPNTSGDPDVEPLAVVETGRITIVEED